MPQSRNIGSPGLREMEQLLNVERIPRKSWNEVKFDIYGRWTPTNSPHHSIISLTGGGKSYLATRGLLPMRGWRRTLLIDNKGDDDTLRDVGRRVREIPDMILGSEKERNLIAYGIGSWFTKTGPRGENK